MIRVIVCFLISIFTVLVLLLALMVADEVDSRTGYYDPILFVFFAIIINALVMFFIFE